jgi:O-antigen/teichoic acid export membrane protein
MNFSKLFNSITKITETKKIASVNISWLLAQNAVKLIFGLTVSLYLAKYLGPEDFGVYSFGISVLSILLLFTNLGIDPILIRELVNKKINSLILMGSSFALTLSGGVLGFLIMGLLGYYYGFSSKIGIVIVLMSPILLLKSLNIINSYFQSSKENKYPALSNIISIIIGSSLILISIKLNFELEYFALIYSFECILLIASLIYFYTSNNVLRKWEVSKKTSLNILKESWPLIIAGAASIINTRIDQVYIGSMLSPSVLGNYSAAAKVSEFWLILPTVLSTVFYPILIDLRAANFNKYKRFLFLLIISCFTFGILFSTIMTYFSQDIILVLFGEKYDLAGKYLTLYIWSTLPYFTLFILSSVIYIENLIKKNLIISGVSIFGNIILNYFFIQFYGAIGAIYATLIVVLISYSILAYHIFKYTKLLR